VVTASGGLFRDRRRLGFGVQPLERAREKGAVRKPSLGFERPQAANLQLDARSLVLRSVDDLAGLRPGLLDDEIRLASRLRAHLVGGPLGRDERVAKERLELARAGKLRFEALDVVVEIGALAPDVLEALGDLVQEPVGRISTGVRDISVC
jgi:hypothetical protein